MSSAMMIGDDGVRAGKTPFKCLYVWMAAHHNLHFPNLVDFMDEYFPYFPQDGCYLL